MNRLLYPKLAWQSLRQNFRFWLPYLLSIIGCSGAFYILLAMAAAPDLPDRTRYAYLSVFTGIGAFVVALFSFIFLFYTNSFLMKRRTKELGLYNVLVNHLPGSGRNSAYIGTNEPIPEEKHAVGQPIEGFATGFVFGNGALFFDNF